MAVESTEVVIVLLKSVTKGGTIKSDVARNVFLDTTRARPHTMLIAATL